MGHHQLVSTALLTIQSFESGALKQGNIEDLQDGVPQGLELDTPSLVGKNTPLLS